MFQRWAIALLSFAELLKNANKAVDDGRSIPLASENLVRNGLRLLKGYIAKPQLFIGNDEGTNAKAEPAVARLHAKLSLQGLDLYSHHGLPHVEPRGGPGGAEN